MPPPALCIILGIVYIISECGGGGQSQVTRPQARSRSRSGEGRVAVTCTGPHWWVWAEMSCKSPQSKLFAAYNLVFNLHFKNQSHFSGRLPLISWSCCEFLPRHCIHHISAPLSHESPKTAKLRTRLASFCPSYYLTKTNWSIISLCQKFLRKCFVSKPLQSKDTKLQQQNVGPKVTPLLHILQVPGRSFV